jgi:mannose-6-phosphate isomerase-like protein (cupin superfamily)
MFKKLINRKFMNPEKVNIESKLSLFNDHWHPRIVGELNGQHIKLVKLLGEFVWHKHDIEDEMFLVIRGILKMEFRDKTVEILSNEFIIVPRGVEHRPLADNEVEIMLFEPASTLNTGDSKGEFTREVLEKI